jgi:SM-20-related protein
MSSEPAALFNLYVDRHFLDAGECRSIIAELRKSEASRATVYGKGDSAAVDERVRKVTRLVPTQVTLEKITQRLLSIRTAISEHFATEVTQVEEPQFLRYAVGDYFVAHQDGNTGMLRLDRERLRRVSVSIFLNDELEKLDVGSYSGGTLVFSDWRSGYKELRFSGAAGTLVAFRSETTHEVTRVTRGDRYSIVSWFQV